MDHLARTIKASLSLLLQAKGPKLSLRGPNLYVPPAGDGDGRRGAVLGSGVSIGAGLEQEAYELEIALVTRQQQRCLARTHTARQRTWLVHRGPCLCTQGDE